MIGPGLSFHGSPQQLQALQPMLDELQSRLSSPRGKKSRSKLPLGGPPKRLKPGVPQALLW